MRVETAIHPPRIQDIPAAARRAEDIGFESIAVPETNRDAFLAAGLAATGTSHARLATSVALAFPRSPMIVAYLTHNLQELSGGRFVVGLGTQVKGHIERRFSTPWDSPGPRLREYVLALRAIWDTWQSGAPLDFQGTSYTFTLMTPEFSPQPHRYPLVVHTAAVNAYNIRLAGEVCDGLRLHPLASPAYVRDIVMPNLRLGAERAGRSLDGFELVGGGFIVTGATESEVAAKREEVRRRIGFYASTRTYHAPLEHHGFEAITPVLRDLIAQNRWADLGSVIDDTILDTFCIAGTYDTIAQRIREQYAGLLDTVGLDMPAGDETSVAAFQRVVEQVRAIEPVHPRNVRESGGA